MADPPTGGVKKVIVARPPERVKGNSKEKQCGGCVRRFWEWPASPHPGLEDSPGALLQSPRGLQGRRARRATAREPRGESASPGWTLPAGIRLAARSGG